MKLLALTKHNSGVDYHRITNPLKYLELADQDSVMEISNRQLLMGSFFENVTTVLYSRDCPFDLDQLLTLKKEIGFKLVVDIDDYWRLPPKHVLYENWNNEDTTNKIIRSIEVADLVTTTHDYLKDKIRPLNENVEVLPNGLPYDKGQFSSEKVDINNILYSCSITHLEDIKALNRFFELCKGNKDVQNYALCVAGFSSVNLTMIDLYAKIEKEGKKFGNFKKWMYLPLHLYMEHYKYAKIAIAPLEDNEFNRCKSNLKSLEAGCKNIPLLASAIHPYSEMPVIHCKTQKDWYTNLKELIRRPELIEERGNALGKFVRENYNLKEINKKRKILYE